MQAMTDLDICKRIAEIEGYHANLAIKCEGVWCSMNDNNCYGVSNPLTDDALCFQLMVKHSIELTHEETGDPYKHHRFVAKKHVSSKVYPTIAVDFKSPNKAICLAIIKAHKWVRTI